MQLAEKDKEESTPIIGAGEGHRQGRELIWRIFDRPKVLREEFRRMASEAKGFQGPLKWEVSHCLSIS
jgi:hypothetical protein